MLRFAMYAYAAAMPKVMIEESAWTKMSRLLREKLRHRGSGTIPSTIGTMQSGRRRNQVEEEDASTLKLGIGMREGMLLERLGLK